jgi:type VI secretion system secreted protein Hcp
MAFDAFVKIDGIDGESSDDAHKGEIEIISYSLGATQAGGASTSRTGGQTGARADIGEFTITKVLETSTPNLFKFCCSGKHIAKIVISICGASESKQTYMQYTLTDAVVSSHRAIGATSAEGARPLEEVSFRFGTISLAYTPYDNTGKAGAAIKAGWDLGANKAL